MVVPDLGYVSADDLEADSSVIFAMDRDCRLTYCNGAWDAFATANGGKSLTRPDSVGSNVLDAIHGPLQPYYREVYRAALDRGESWQQTFECSSPDRFREFNMRIFPIPKSSNVMVVNSLCVDRPHEREAQQGVESAYRDPEGIIVMCSHCRRTRCARDERWDWVPAYVENPPPNISHGLCGPCLEYYYSRT